MVRFSFREILLAGGTLLALLVHSELFGATGTFTFEIPKTAYVGWIKSPTGSMMGTGRSDTLHFEKDGRLSEATQEEFYLGVMCNSLAGYDLILMANNPGATAQTGRVSSLMR